MNNKNGDVILYCHNDYSTTKGGEYNVFENDVMLLEKMGYRVIRYEGNNSDFFQANILGKIFLIFHSFFNYKIYKEIKRIIEKEKIDFAIIQNTYLIFSPSIYVAFYKKNIPIIQMIYNYRFICPNAHLYTKGAICERCINGHYHNAVLKKCLRESYLISLWYAVIVFISRKLLKVDKKISSFIVPDEFSKIKHVQGGIEKEKISVAKNPFAVTNLIEYTDEGYFLFIGRLIKQKGIYTFLKAALKLPNLRFKIIGEGEEEIAIKEFIGVNKLKNIDFLGAMYGQEMEIVLRNTRALIVPSEWYDNYPVVISLAYNLSKPVIATNINGLPEVVINNKTGLLFEIGNVEDLCQKINYLAKNVNKAKELGNNARTYLDTELNEEKRIKIIEEVLSNVKK